MWIFIRDNWSDLLLAIVGLSALIVYYFQNRDVKCSAATLIVGQIKSIEQNISALKSEHQLNNIAVYNSKSILKENHWEQYKHLFVKNLSSEEYELLQRFFDLATRIEHERSEIISSIELAWNHKSNIEQQRICDLIVDNIDCKDKLENEINRFLISYRDNDVVFTSNLAINGLIKNLNNAFFMSGTTAYKRLQKYSYFR